MKKCLSYLIECLLVSKHTNQVLKEVARCIAALLFVLFLSGVDLDWLEHCPTCQEVSLDVQEVQG